jgi:hypothetical protein
MILYTYGFWELYVIKLFIHCLAFISQKGHVSCEICLWLAKWDYIVQLHHNIIKNLIYIHKNSTLCV